MNVLGIETSSPRGSVALVADGSVLGELQHGEANRHAELLRRLLDQLLAEANIDRRSLDLVAVGLGPGSFTGLRVGIALASGIALGLGIPLVGVPSLTALTHGLRLDQPCLTSESEGPEWLGALTDARRGEYFFAAFTRALESVVEPCLVRSEQAEAQLATLLGSRSVWIAGGLALQQLPSRWLPPPVNEASRGDGQRLLTHAQFPSATSVALLANTRHATLDVGPLYLRDADAKRPTLPPNPLRNVG